MKSLMKQIKDPFIMCGGMASIGVMGWFVYTYVRWNYYFGMNYFERSVIGNLMLFNVIVIMFVFMRIVEHFERINTEGLERQNRHHDYKRSEK